VTLSVKDDYLKAAFDAYDITSGFLRPLRLWKRYMKTGSPFSKETDKGNYQQEICSEKQSTSPTL